jgi:hypothetical protein
LAEGKSAEDAKALFEARLAGQAMRNLAERATILGFEDHAQAASVDWKWPG